MDSERARDFMKSLVGPQPSQPCMFRFWDGLELSFGESPVFVLHFRTPEAFDELLSHASLGFGEAYMRGDIAVDGDLGAVLELAYRENIFAKLSPAQKASVCWLNLKRRAGLKQTRKDVQTHYDRGNDFYRLWLDEGMNYSCAYFTAPDDSLEQAQSNKIDHILHKLRLQPGQRLLDIGCGWGQLIIQAAKNYGVYAVGLTLSEQQYEMASRRVSQEGLSNQVEIHLADYREYAVKDPFDRIVSVGMFEHVGKENIPVFFKKSGELLRRNGLMLLHTIGRIRPACTDPWVEKYIFPGGYIPALREAAEAADSTGLDFLDLENLRTHYSMTIEHWIRRFEASVSEITKLMGEDFVRMWRLYLNGSRISFMHGTLHLFQFLFSKGRLDAWPLTREWIYNRCLL